MLSIKEYFSRVSNANNVNEGKTKHINALSLLTSVEKASNDIPDEFIVPTKDLKNLVKSKLWTDLEQYADTTRTEDLVNHINNTIASKKIFESLASAWNETITSITSEYSNWADNMAAGRAATFERYDGYKREFNAAFEDINDTSNSIESLINVLHCLDDLASDPTFEGSLVSDTFDWQTRYNGPVKFSLNIVATDAKSADKAYKTFNRIAHKYKFNPSLKPGKAGNGQYNAEISF